MWRYAAILTGVAIVAAMSVLAGQAALRAAAPFSFALDLRSSTFTIVPQPPRDVSVDGASITVDNKRIVLPYTVVSAELSPDGRLVAAETVDTSGCGFAPPRCGRFSVWVVNRNGSGLSLFSPAATDPAWSPDSRRLAFVGAFDTATLTGTVSVANDDGTDRRVLSGRDGAKEPTWSADGTLIAYTRATGSRSWLRVVRAADARVLIVVDHAARPAWARSGRRLSFVRFLSSRDGLELWNGSRMRLLTTTARGMTTLTWSPDARSIAFARRGINAAIGVALADGSRVRLFQLPGSSRSGADVTKIDWTGLNELAIAGRFYGTLPRVPS